MPRLLVASFLSITVLACSERGLTPVFTDDPRRPILSVDPGMVDFGPVAEEETRLLTVRNVGDDVLHLEAPIFLGSASFAIADPTSLPEILFPGASAAFRVSFTPPGAGPHSAQLILVSDDPTNPRFPVFLSGSGVVPSLRIAPSPHDFGPITIGCDAAVDLTLSNVGSGPLAISAIDLVDPDGVFSLHDPHPPPTVLPPMGGAIGVTVSVTPVDPGPLSARLEVSSDDPRGVVSALLTARAVHAAAVTDVFTLPTDPPVDILFAVDQSCSMDGHSQNLAENFGTFIESLSTVTDGWQIGVVTLDTGCVNDVVFTPTTTDLVTRFGDAVALGDWMDVAYTEQLFRVVQTALANTLPGRCNEGLLRPDAPLHVVLVSDEREQSGIPPASFVQTVGSYTSPPGQASISGVVCPDAGCPWADGTNAGYREAILLGGGERLDILTEDWGRSVQQLAAASVAGLGRFPLSQAADPSSIAVAVDGTDRPTGWWFDAGSNEIVFDAPPPSGATVEVTYGALIPCP